MTTLLHEPAARFAASHADAVAVTLGDEIWTYGELDARANAIGRCLIEAGCRPDDRVCLFVPKSPLAVASMLGCLKAGLIYVPIDLASPSIRLAKIVHASDPAAMLVAGTGRDVLAATEAIESLARTVTIGLLDDTDTSATFDANSLAAAAGSLPRVDRSPDDAAHILFTSGSTGTPKGVVITHANVAAFLDWAIPYFGIDADDRLSGHPPFHFDLSTFDIFASLWTGAQLHLVPAAANLLPRDLSEFIRAKELTQWFSVPTVLAYMEKLGAIPAGGYPTLKRILWCGDVLPTPVLRTWMARHPGVPFTNLYGPTESTIASSFFTLTEPPRDDTDAVPIGHACAGEELLVLDRHLEPTGPGETGDLYIGGAGLSPGYWRDDEKTAAAFLSDPRGGGGRIYRTGDLARRRDDGPVMFAGRTDSQIKSRGHRIELGEVETALNSLAAVNEVAVVAIETGDFDGKAICCAWTPGAAAPEGDRLRAELHSLIPSYMLPSRWLRLEQLPKNSNGKIDRRCIRELFGESPTDDDRAPVAGARAQRP
jgi:amino acid adenylation domain-containing protein